MQDNEATVFKEANQFVCLNFWDNQLTDMNFLSGTTSLDSCLKAYKIEAT